jgi:hypothetical protein
MGLRANSGCHQTLDKARMSWGARAGDVGLISLLAMSRMLF